MRNFKCCDPLLNLEKMQRNKASNIQPNYPGCIAASDNCIFIQLITCIQEAISLSYKYECNFNNAFFDTKNFTYILQFKFNKQT